MSCNKHRLGLAIASLIAVISVPTMAQAHRGHARGYARPVIVTRYASPYYDPFFWGSYGWGYPGWYGGPAFYHNTVPTSSARVQVTPRQTAVYVDGYLVGVADDFDGAIQRLRVDPGEHVIELYLEGHKTIAQTINFAPGQSYRIRHAMEAIAAGDVTPVRPTPKPGGPSPAQRGFDALGQPTGRTPASGPMMTGGSSIAIRVRPGDAVILIDGERWQGSGGERFEIQVSPGEHRIEVQKDGYQPFSTSVRVAPGDNSSLNVSLTKSEGE